MLTPEEIRSREFLVSLRGYDRDEVHAFLDELAAEVAALRSGDAAGTSAPSDSSPANLFQQLADETRSVLEAAHAAGEEIKRRAQEQASAQLEEAQRATEELAAERERRIEESARALATLRQRRDALLAGLRDIAERAATTADEVLAADEQTDDFELEGGSDLRDPDRVLDDLADVEVDLDVDAELDRDDEAEVDVDDLDEADLEGLTAPDDDEVAAAQEASTVAPEAVDAEAEEPVAGDAREAHRT